MYAYVSRQAREYDEEVSNIIIAFLAKLEDPDEVWIIIDGWILKYEDI